MATIPRILKWIENYNGSTIERYLDLYVHPADSPIVFLTVAGLGGTANGYKNKYIDIVENAFRRHGVAAVRMGNPYYSTNIVSNVRVALSYILKNSNEITNGKLNEIYIQGHSAGATITAMIAWEYPEITRLLLINPVPKFNGVSIVDSLEKFTVGDASIMYGEHDPSAEYWRQQSTLPNILVSEVKNADHHFSGNSFDIFINAAQEHLFNKK